ncbi:hypothetical protein SteCoe_29411 [Stentor coeruleus]|uniref:Dickkopf N-terminal cysteine-rich domain-containing protein n=1 Tax=Stentor coeruleus TaxID=5963 RepID=A0A1R2B6A0_9CILI|nr:hypothetical protein SteCoe_29411 [Stentor coeruleus]
MFFALLLSTVLACFELTCDFGLNSSYCMLSDSMVYVSTCQFDDGVTQTCPLGNIQYYLNEFYKSGTLECKNSTSSTSSTVYSNQKTGYPCNSDKDCKNNKCVDNRCEGRGYKQSCTEDADCQPDMYCKTDYSSKYCITSLKAGDYCDFDNECASGLGCGRGICKKLMSLEVGEKTDLDIFCKSQIKNENGYCDAIEIYSNNVLLQSPYACTIGDICIYQFANTNNSYKSLVCECDGTSSSTGYCGTYVNFTQEYTSALANVLNYDTSLCSGDDASSVDPDILYLCQSISLSQYYYYTNWTATAKYWSLFSSHIIDDCASELGIFTPGWNWNKSAHLFLSGLIMAFYAF